MDYNSQTIHYNRDISPELVHPDFRTKRQRRLDAQKEMAPAILVGIAILAFFLPYIAELLLLVAGYFFAVANKQKTDYRAIAIPVHALPKKKRPLFYSRRRYRVEKSKPVGDILIGIDRVSRRQVWLASKTMNRHLFISGTTGSGKTIFLFGLIYMYISMGSGCCMIDAKGTVVAFWHFFSMARRLDRADDVYLLNFFRASLEHSPELLKGKYRVSNTIQPFETGSAEELRSLLGTMFRSMKEEIWKSKALALLYAILIVLIDRRDRLNIPFGINELREHLAPKYALCWAHDDTIPELARTTILNMLREGGGFKESILFDPKDGSPRDKNGIMEQLADPENGEFQTQWSYLTMQMTESFQMLGVEYKGIFGSASGEIDFKDMVLQRRLCFIILPSLEKDEESLVVLAKFIIAGLKRFFSAVTQATVQGDRQSIYDADMTRYHIPFLFVCDEVNRYGADVEGLGAAAALARSLNICFIFAGQQIGSLEHKNKGVFNELWGNTDFKFGMKIDEDRTVEVYSKRAGEAYVAKARHYERSSNSPVYTDKYSGEIERNSRLNIRSFVKLKAGQSYFIKDDDLLELNVFGALAEEAEGHIDIVPELKLNELFTIRRPTPDFVEAYSKPVQMLNDLATGRKTLQAPKISSKKDALTGFISAFNLCQKKAGLNNQDASLLSIALLSDDPAKLMRYSEELAQEGGSDDEHEGEDSFSKDELEFWNAKEGASKDTEQANADGDMSEIERNLQRVEGNLTVYARSTGIQSDDASKESWGKTEPVIHKSTADTVKSLYRLDLDSVSLDEKKLNEQAKESLSSDSYNVDEVMEAAINYKKGIGDSICDDSIFAAIDYILDTE